MKPPHRQPMNDAPHPVLDRLSWLLNAAARGPGTAKQNLVIAPGDGSSQDPFGSAVKDWVLRFAAGSTNAICGDAVPTPLAPPSPAKMGLSPTNRIHPPTGASPHRLEPISIPKAMSGTPVVPMNFWVSRCLTTPATPPNQWATDIPLSCLERTEFTALLPRVGSNEPDGALLSQLNHRS